MNETSVKKLWKTLEEKYMKKSLENRFYMKKKLYQFTYTPSMSMNDHCELMQQDISRFAKFG